MTDLAKGMIEIDGFTITPETTLDEMRAFFREKARVLELSTGPKLKFIKPFYVTENIYAYAFNFNKTGKLKGFSLIPVTPPDITDTVDIAESKVNIAKKWLKNMTLALPNTEHNGGITYSYNWGFISSAIRSDIHYGVLGGEIDVYMREE